MFINEPDNYTMVIYHKLEFLFFESHNSRDGSTLRSAMIIFGTNLVHRNIFQRKYRWSEKTIIRIFIRYLCVIFPQKLVCPLACLSYLLSVYHLVQIAEYSFR